MMRVTLLSSSEVLKHLAALKGKMTANLRTATDWPDFRYRDGQIAALQAAMDEVEAMVDVEE